MCVFVRPHRLTIQMLVDFDDPAEWVNEELVVSVPTHNGVEDGPIQLTVHVLCHQLQSTHAHMQAAHKDQRLLIQMLGFGDLHTLVFSQIYTLGELLSFSKLYS